MRNLIKLYFNGQRESGAYIINACVTVNEDYTMNEVVKAIHEAGYISFVLPTMKKAYFIPEDHPAIA